MKLKIVRWIIHLPTPLDHQLEKLSAPTQLQFPLFGLETPKVELTNDVIYEHIEFP